MSRVAAVTFGLPSRSPPIQLPIRKKLAISWPGSASSISAYIRGICGRKVER